jgi:hypothetical protein
MPTRLMDTEVPSEKQRLLWYSSTVVALCLVSILAYSGSLRLPFVQDDWHALYAAKTVPAVSYLADAFWPIGKLLYRPLGATYFLLLYKLFGLAPLGFHIIALALHTLNAFLVFLIAGRLTGRMPIAAAAGVLFVAAATIHADTLLWMVGFYDLGTLCLFLTAFLLYLNGRTTLSAAAFALSLFVKESAVALAAVFFLHALLLDRQRLRSLRPHLVLLALYVVVRSLGWPVAPPDHTETYEVAFSQSALLTNMKSLFRWSFEVLFPFWTADSTVVGSVGIAAVVIGLLVGFSGKVGREKRFALGLFLLGWIITGLIPVLFLKHQFFRYYAVYSLGPFLLLAVLLLMRLLASIPRLPQIVAASTLVVFVLANAGVNATLQNERFQSGSAPAVRTYDGTNHLIRKCAIVRSVQNQTLERYPSLQPGAMIVLGGIDRTPFGGSLGPRLWYNDTTITVCTKEEYDSLGTSNTKQMRQVLVLTFSGDTLVRQP